MTASIWISCLARLPAQARLLFLFQAVDQVDGVEEAHPLARVDGGDAEGRRQVAFPRARPADQNQIARLRHEARRGELLDVGLLEGRLGPVEAGEVAVDGEAGRADLVAQAARLAVGLLGLDELVEQGLGASRPRWGCRLMLGPGGGHAVQVHGLELCKPVNGHGASPAGCRSVRSRPQAPGAAPGPARRPAAGGAAVPPACAWRSAPPAP
jgi:hypothetical protein